MSEIEFETDNSLKDIGREGTGTEVSSMVRLLMKFGVSNKQIANHLLIGLAVFIFMLAAYVLSITF